MPLRKVFFLTSLVCVSFLLTGALRPEDFPGLDRTCSPPCPASFHPGPITLPDGWDTQGAVAYLDSLVQTFRPADLPWLDMDLWQRCENDDTTFTATGRLIWAPEQRTRLEWKVQGPHASTLVVVSDGRHLQRSLQLSRETPEIARYRLPDCQDSAENSRRGWRILESHGCTGFLPLLTELRARGKDWVKEAGHWRDRPVLRLTATLSPQENTGIPRAAADLCRIFLDGQNLWPLRLEWSKRSRVFLEMEFRQPRVGAPTTADVAQLFSLDSR
jgi:hypothetical protein